jgi:NADPH:quinone reductase-like Zn-dependent oxidoreductase
VPQEQMGTIAEFVAVNSELVAKSLKYLIRSGWITVSRVNFKRWKCGGIKENDRVLIHAGSGGVGSLQFSMPK